LLEYYIRTKTKLLRKNEAILESCRHALMRRKKNKLHSDYNLRVNPDGQSIRLSLCELFCHL